MFYQCSQSNFHYEFYRLPFIQNRFDFMRNLFNFILFPSAESVKISIEMVVTNDVRAHASVANRMQIIIIN